MHNLHVIPSVNPKTGGPIAGLTQFYYALRRVGVGLDVLSGDRFDDPWVEESPFDLVHCSGPSFFNYTFNTRLYRWIIENGHRYDAFIIQGLWQYHTFAVSRAAMRLKKPYFVYTHGMLDPYFKYAHPIKHLKKKLYWALCEKDSVNNATSVFFTSEEERLLARQSFNQYNVNEYVIGYGISKPEVDKELAMTAFYERFDELVGKRFVLFLGRIHPKKGCDVLIQAFKDASKLDSEVHLVIAGPDQIGWRRDLERRVQEYGLNDRVVWTGHLQNELKWGAYYSADVFCLPSHQENFGIVVAEALACSLPVIISNKVNIWREIEGENAGIVCEDDVNGTMNALQKWITMSSIAKGKMRDASLQCYEKNFDIRVAASNYVSHILNSLNNA